MRAAGGHAPPSSADDPMKECILLAACGASEVLPQNPDLPADVFTACLTTPIKASLLPPVAQHAIPCMPACM